MGCLCSINTPKVRGSSDQISGTSSSLKLSQHIRSSSFIQCKHTPIQHDYELGAKFASGAYGSVRRATFKATGEVRAVKTIQKSQIQDEFRTQFFAEVDILQSTDHPNILHLYEFYEEGTRFHLVTELVTGGELLEFILSRGVLTEAVAAYFFKQLLSALCYCHSKGIVHRDLKPENLLLVSDSEDAILKVIDFGTSAELTSTEKMAQQCGTSYYIAPEVIDEVYDFKCDLWSCGVILFILLSGKPPFYGKTEDDVLQSVKRGRFSFTSAEWTNVSDEAKEFIKRLLTKSPELRPTAAEALEDPWFVHAAAHTTAKPNLETSFASLKQFQTNQELQSAVVTFICSQLVAREETHELAQVFQSLDVNSDGKLSKEELLEGYRVSVGSEEAVEVVEQIMNQVDSDENGYIEYSEFVAASVRRETLLSQEHLAKAFRKFDTDGNGKISAKELRQVLGRPAGCSTWKELIGKVDLNNDGEIDLEEFTTMMQMLVTEVN